MLKDKQQYEKFKQVPKLLILGTGDSGKTTFLKQMSILDGKKYSKDEVESFRIAIIDQIVDSLKIIGGICQEKGWPLSREQIDMIDSLRPDNTGSYANMIEAMIADAHVQKALIIGHQYNMVSNAE